MPARGAPRNADWQDAKAGTVAEARAYLALGEGLLTDGPEPVPEPADLWPEGAAVDFHDMPVAIARTEPPERGTPGVAEIERLYLDAIASARRCIYIESQYFASGSITRAIAARLIEPDGPEVVIVLPRSSESRSR